LGKKVLANSDWLGNVWQQRKAFLVPVGKKWLEPVVGPRLRGLPEDVLQRQDLELRQRDRRPLQPDALHGRHKRGSENWREIKVLKIGAKSPFYNNAKM
jgi:hypothetical protein